jgi:hypothetical protein
MPYWPWTAIDPETAAMPSRIALPFLSRLAVLACAALLLAACAKTFEDVLAEHRVAVEAVFSQLKMLDGKVSETPRLEQDGIDLGGASVVLDGDKSNAVFVRATHLANPLSADREGMGGTHAYTVATCAESLRGEFDGAPGGMEAFMSECRRAEYAFVLRSHAEVMAQLIDSQTFQPGIYDGEVLLFRLSDGNYMGGFRVTAQSSDEVSVTVDSAGNPIDPIERLNSDMTSQVFSQIEAKLKEHVPGVMP